MFFKHHKIKGVEIIQPSRISGIGNIEFGNNIVIDSYSFIYANRHMKIGSNVHIASFTFLNGAESITIGDFTGIYQGTKVYAGTDDFRDWGFGNITIDEKYRNPQRRPVAIGRFCVLGANCVIGPGVTIGEGASVGACSVVTRDLEPWGIYIGNKRVAERNKAGVLENYERYLKEKGGKK
jgi:acetyltransferase-like isoleucine patch superfamily enzyme